MSQITPAIGSAGTRVANPRFAFGADAVEQVEAIARALAGFFAGR